MLKKLITIDGPSGVGKGTASRFVAKALDWEWLDSGALYRLTALDAGLKNVNLDDSKAVAQIASHLNVSFAENTKGEPDILLDAKVVNDLIRTEQCGNAASKIAAFPEVRTALLQRQRDFYTSKGLVADGRDMGTIVFPDAPLKVFLTANAAVRAQRRWKQLQEQGLDVNIADLLHEIEARDQRDQTRAVAPLKPAPDALVIDTSYMNIVEVEKAILARAHEIFHE
ncbi:MAG: cytidylate kinase [Gammaproteobacteria bacterium]|jgi:cytidylate kinase|nr:cytidylate kinase [Gammaproteobacteria bacterium]